MSKEISYDTYSKTVDRVEATGLSTAEIRLRQNFERTEKVNTLAQEKLVGLGYERRLLPNADSQTAAGSFDYGIIVRNGRVYFVIYEGNGSSHRGHHLAPPENEYELVQRINHAYANLVRPGMNVVLPYKRGDVHQLGVDRYMIRREIKNDEAFNGKVIAGCHEDLLAQLELRGKDLYIKDRKVHVFLGEGTPRRFEGELRQSYDANELDILVANRWHEVLDRKDNTYRAIDEIIDDDPFVANCLEELGFMQIGFTTVSQEKDENEQVFLERLAHSVYNQLEIWPTGVVVKWPNSSGAAGMKFFIPNGEITVDFILDELKDGLQAFRKKIGGNSHIGDVTLQEYADSVPFEYENPNPKYKDDKDHNLDARCYWANSNGIEPVFYLFRIAPKPKSQGPGPCNLSAQKGIDMRRGYGICQETFEALRKSLGSEEEIIEVLANMAAISVILATELANRHTPSIPEEFKQRLSQHVEQ